MKTRSYQIALIVSVSICVLLAAALAFVLLRHNHSSSSAPAQNSSDPVLARGPEQASQANAAQQAAEPALTPVQISPQRLQQIGVTYAPVTFKDVKDQLSVPGNVDIDEQLLSYVQTRYAGWIQNVSANATYQYVRKGQRLFTIYSPDLVSSEQELLLARKNKLSSTRAKATTCTT